MTIPALIDLVEREEPASPREPVTLAPIPPDVAAKFGRAITAREAVQRILRAWVALALVLAGALLLLYGAGAPKLLGVALLVLGAFGLADRMVLALIRWGRGLAASQGRA